MTTPKRKEQIKESSATIRIGTQKKLDAVLAKLDEALAMLRELLKREV